VLFLLALSGFDRKGVDVGDYVQKTFVALSGALIACMLFVLAGSAFAAPEITLNSRRAESRDHPATILMNEIAQKWQRRATAAIEIKISPPISW
jgi:TRAP-type C4-dicarboxylate transport system substrate-binding protein